MYSAGLPLTVASKLKNVTGGSKFPSMKYGMPTPPKDPSASDPIYSKNASA